MDKMIVRQRRQALRQQVKQIRQQIMTTDRNNWSVSANQHLITWLKEQSYQSVMLYSALPAELDLTSTIKWCWEQALTVYLPKTNPADHSLIIYEVRSFEELKDGAMGIQEPYLLDRIARDVIPDVTIVPGVAFDRQGNRLGYGAGYYDRWLAALDGRHRPYMIGLAFEQQVIDDIPSEDHDLQLDMLVTEQRIYRFT